MSMTTLAQAAEMLRQYDAFPEEVKEITKNLPAAFAFALCKSYELTPTADQGKLVIDDNKVFAANRWWNKK